MIFIICCMKSKISYNRLKTQFDNNYSWEDYIDDLDEVQEKLIFNYYDLAIIDEKLWWKNEVIDLLKKKSVKIIKFQGDFEEIEHKVNELYPKQLEDTDSKNKEKFEEANKNNDDREIRYIEKEIIIEKQVKVPVLKYKSIYTGIQSKLIAILNLSDDAGSTFITLNLAKALSEYNILTSVIEPPIKKTDIFDIIGLEYRLNKISEGESLKFYSYAHHINDGEKLEKDRETIEDGIVWLVPDPRKPLIKNWDYYKMMKLIYASKKAPITLIDCGNNFEHESIKPILSEVDMVLVVIDPLPSEIMNNVDKLDELIEMKEKGLNVEFVINKWNSGVDKKMLLQFLKISPIMYIPFIDIDLVYGAIYKCKIPYSIHEVKDKLEKQFTHFIKKVIPIELINNSNEENKTFKSRILSKFIKR